MKAMDIFTPVSALFEDAEKELDTWTENNRNLQKDIDNLRQLVKTLTANAIQIHRESDKVTEVTMVADPQVKLRMGNTRNIANIFEQPKSKPGLPTGAVQGQRSAKVNSVNRRSVPYKTHMPEIRFSSHI
ncbi:uncharacterized protein LOC122259821 [Penaeus japonicus]|uniref:uncharacterized protein LOC122259821 n=1 Tax=Penaeus japonicus TaxID=27405 RepID=UPI001C7128B6|nr:uncharacterized protein LOC122259821 [Penaeus japonicus]